MNTYLEAISHVRKHKAFFKLEAIAKAININADQFRQIVNRRGAKNLPEKYRAEFIKVVTELCRVEQVDCDGSQNNTINEAIDLFYRSNSADSEPF